MKKIKGFLIFLFTWVFTYLLWRSVETLPEYLGLVPYLKINLRLVGILFIFSLCGFLLLKINKELKIYLILSSLSLFTALSVAFLYKDSEYGIGGDIGDLGFLTSYITKLAAFGYNTDVFYKNLSGFYPPLYYYLLALVSKLTGDQPYQMLKIGMIFSPALIIFVTFHLWRKFVLIEIAAILSFSILIFQDWYKTGAWISLIIFIPWWLYYLENNFLNPNTNKRLSIWHFIKGGILGAIVIQLQYYWFFTAIIASTLLFLFLIFKDDRQEIYLNIKNKLIIASLSLLFSLPYWGPYLYNLITIGNEPMQNRWYEDWMGNIFLPFTEPGLANLFYLFGLLYLAIIIKKDRIAFLLLLITISSYLWIGLGFFFVLLKIPVLHFKTNYLIHYLLGINALYSLGSLFLSDNLIPHSKIIKNGVYAISLILLIFFSQNFQNLESGIKDSNYFKKERNTFATLSNNNNYNKVAIASDLGIRILLYFPTFVFQTGTHYAHPSALYNERNIFLEKLSKIKDPELFGMILMNNRFDKIDYLFFDGPENKLILSTDSFPYPINQKHIIYPDSILSEKIFNKQELDNFRLYTIMHKKNILSDPGRKIEKFSLSELVTIYSMVTLFDEALSPNIITHYKNNEIFELIKQKTQNDKGKNSNLIRLAEIMENAKKSNIRNNYFKIKKIAETLEFLKNKQYVALSSDAYIFKSDELNSNVNELIYDEYSYSKKVLTNNKPGTTNINHGLQKGFMVFGPYMNLDRGNYKAIFHLKSTQKELTKTSVGFIDVYCHPKIIERKDLDKESIFSDSTFKEIEIGFYLNKSTSNIEFRLFCEGNTEIRFDYLEIIQKKIIPIKI